MRALLLALVALLLHSAGATGEIVVHDDMGRSVSLPGPATRIVALAPHIVENLFAAGAGASIVGAVDYSDFPAAASSIPRVGSFNAFSMEAIIATRPDLIIMWGSGNGMSALPKLETLGVPVVISEPRRIEDIVNGLRLFATVAGTHGEKAAVAFDQEMTALRERHAGNAELSVFLQLWNQPLQTVSGDHLISEVISFCGGRNAFADARTLAPKLAMESVLRRDPDVIIASGAGPQRPDWLDDWYNYPSLSAVRSNALFYINPDYLLRPTPRVLLGARELCDKLDSVRLRQ